MTADRIVFYGCVALWAVAVLVVSDQMGAGQMEVLNGRDTSADTAAKSASAPTNAARPDVVASGMPVKPGNSLTALAAPLTTSDLAALLSRCLEAALSDGPDSPAFIYTDPFTEQRLEIYCDAQPALKVASYERRHIQ